MNRALLVASFALSLVTFPQVAATAADDSTVHQIGTYDYLLQPDFTGLQQAGKVTDRTTLGLGTFANLDGELVMVGGCCLPGSYNGNPRTNHGQRTHPICSSN